MKNYREIYHVSLPGYRETIKYLKDRLLCFISKSSVVLDAGCGSHNQLMSKNKVGLLIGCDVDENSIRKNLYTCMGVVGDLEAMGFRENVFDLIMSFDVVEHLENPQAFIKNAARSLKKGGLIFLVTPNRNSICGFAARLMPYQAKVYFTKILTGTPTSNQVHWYRLNSPSLMVKTLESNGFHHIRLTILNRLPSNPNMKRLLFPYYQICKLKYFARFSTGLLCVARKV